MTSASPSATNPDGTAGAGTAAAGAGASTAPGTDTGHPGAGRALKPARFAVTGSPQYAVLIALLATFFLTSNIAATQQMNFGPWVVDGGVFLFPLTYLLGGVVSEIFGFRAALRATVVGFVVMAVAAGVLGLAALVPSAGDTENQQAFALLFSWDGVYVGVLVGSLVAFFIGQSVNAFIITRIKSRLGERNLWARFCGSTVLAQILDTFLFGIIAFVIFPPLVAGLDPFFTVSDFLSYWIFGVVFKSLAEVVLLPVTYTVVGYMKRRVEWHQ